MKLELVAFHLCLDVLGGVSVGVGSLDHREVTPCLRPPPDRAGAGAETDRPCFSQVLMHSRWGVHWMWPSP